MQERPRGKRASPDLGPSFLIHAKTAKGVNSAIGKSLEVFSQLSEGLEASMAIFA